MKYFYLSLLSCAMLVYALPALSGESYLSHYEVNLDDGISVKTVRGSCYFTPGKPVVNEMGAYTVTLAIAVAADNKYVLTAQLAGPAAQAGTATGLLKQSFNGQLADTTHGPLEFKMDRAGLKVYGAMTLAAVNR